MRRAKRLGLAAVAGMSMTSGAMAQTTGGTGSTGTGGTATSTGGSTGGITTATTGSGGSTGLQTTTPGLGNATSLAPTADLSGISIGQTTSPSSVDASNSLGGYYANPFYQGSAGATESTPPGGFGAPLYGGTTGARGSVATGAARTNPGATGRATTSTMPAIGGLTGTGGIGGARVGGAATGRGAAGIGLAGTTGRGGTAGGGITGTQTIPNLLTTTTSNFAASAQGGQIVALPRPIAYLAEMRFPVAATPPAAVQSNLQAILGSSTQVSTTGGIQVVAETSGAVVLRGAVQNEDEARLAEGMVRLTPGVRDVRNELTYPPSNGTSP